MMKKVDFSEIESIMAAMQGKADSDVMMSQISELKSLLLSKLTKIRKDSSQEAKGTLQEL